MQIKFKDKIYEGERDQIIKNLRVEERLSYRRIADLIGLSYTYVGRILKKAGLNEIDFPELRDPLLFEDKSDFQIASDLNIPVSRVTSARKNLGLKKKGVVKVKNRQRSLAKFLFGQSYAPGPQFDNFIKTYLEALSPKKAELVDLFYLQGKMEASADHINSDTNRIWRSRARKDLKDLLRDKNAKELVQLGVLNDRNSS
jgi:hypothetical protein